MANTITVSTLSGLYTALAGAKGGETILLAGGDYGKLELIDGRLGVDATFPSNVTITAADPDNPPVFSGVDLRRATNLTFDGVVFDYTFREGHPIYHKPFSFEDCQNITLRNSVVDGDLARGVSAAEDGLGWAQGLNFGGGRNITIENVEMFGFYKGLVMGGIDGAVVRNNDLHGMRMDGMNFATMRDLLIEGNHIHDFNRSSLAADHADMIQFWTNGATRPSSNVMIRGNLLDVGTGDATQSIFMRNDMVDRGLAGAEMFYQNITIEENVIINGHSHGITVGETAGLVIRNNSVLHSDGSKADGADSTVEIPRINMAAASTGVSITNNATGGLSGWSSQSGWTVRDNAFVQDQDPRAPGYYGDVFLSSSLQVSGGAHDFRALEGGMLDRLNAGATQTRDISTTGVEARFHVTSDAENAALRTFDATMSASDLGALPRDTVFQWDFGDGTTARGTTVSHAFAEGGIYNVSLTIIRPGSVTSTVKLPVAVSGPEVLSMSSGQGFIAYEAGAEIVIAPPAAMTAEGLQLGAKGVAAWVQRAHVTDILGAHEFAISLTLKADVKGASGEVFNLPGSFVAAVDSTGEMSLRAFTTAGEVKLLTKGALLGNGASHDIRIDLSNDKLLVMVDGKLVGSAVMSGTLISNGDHGLAFGNPWGAQNFNGDLKAFQITKDAADFLSVPQTTVISNPFDIPALVQDAPATVLSMTAQTGFIAFDLNAEIEIGSSPALGADGLQLGARGVAIKIAREHVVDILGADEFSIDFSLQADVQNASGELFRLPGSFVAKVSSRGELHLTLLTTDGAVKIVTKGAALGDGDLHDIGIALLDGQLRVMVDGDLAGAAAMPGTLLNSGNHNLTFGNPWGSKNFLGDITVFEISTEADDSSAGAQALDPISARIDMVAKMAADPEALPQASHPVFDKIFQDAVHQDTAPAARVQDALADLGDRFEFLVHHHAADQILV